uniref:Uncharacterized protein n=1 Tax=viral metagenome TaxID=1070528 RepID=A0A6M3L492_9ZZZZ
MDGRIKLSEETLKLQQYITTQEDGTELSYLEIEQATGIDMNERGKQILRRGIKRARREYSTIRGYGIKLACPETTLPILSGKIIKIDRCVKRAEKTHHTLQEQFFSQLSPEEQKQILFAGAVFGAIRIAAENGKLIYKRKNAEEAQKYNEIKIALPDIS